MAREYARVKLAIWEDDEFRTLSREAQHLYFVLLTSPKLDYCGVTDWRPGRVAALAGGWTAYDVETAAKELCARLYLVIDEDTEEVLIRSFVRNDGLMEQPNVAVSMRRAHAAIASATLRGVVIHELIRLHADSPSLKGWAKVSDMLDKASVDPSVTPSVTASVTPSVTASVTASERDEPKGSVDPSPTPAPSPAPSPATPSGGARKRATRLPDDWRPTAADIEWQRSKGISDALARRAFEKFGNYWRAKSGKDATKLDWSLTWHTWLLTEQERAPKSAAPKRPDGWEFGMN